jgi:hypothetical protein
MKTVAFIEDDNAYREAVARVVEASADLRTWATVPFSLAPGGATTVLHRATAVGTQSLFVSAGGSSRFYRLVVR